MADRLVWMLELELDGPTRFRVRFGNALLPLP